MGGWSLLGIPLVVKFGFDAYSGGDVKFLPCRWLSRTLSPSLPVPFMHEVKGLCVML